MFSQYIQSNSSEEEWMNKLIPGGNIVYFYCGLSILGIISCVVQRKKFDKNKWCNIIKTEKHKNKISNVFEKMIQGKDWNEPDLMEYDLEKMEIRVLNKNPKTYTIPSNWED
ncbi:MAG: hypothetical protein RR373_09300, partial [Akkermansia sp.]